MGRNGADWGLTFCSALRMSSDVKTEPAKTSVRLNGTFEHTLDDKKRLQIPSKWRSEHSPTEWTAVLWPNNGFLIAMPTFAYTEMTLKLERRGRGDRGARDLLRYFSENSADLVIDKAGRVPLPEKLLNEVSIEKEVMLVGMGSEFEIWPLARFREKAVIKPEMAELNIAKYLSESEEPLC